MDDGLGKHCQEKWGKSGLSETGAGRRGHGNIVCLMECEIYMGAEDMERQSPNVYRMNLLGPEEVELSPETLKESPINEAFRDWATNIEDTFYLIGSAVGPSPVSDYGT